MQTSISILPQTYRFFPKKSDQKSKFGEGGVRFYYYGQIQHDQFQKKKLEQFYQYLRTKKLELPNTEYFNVQKVLLILQGNQFKNQKTYNAIVEHWNWMKATLPVKLTTKIEEILKSGYFYISGRDYQFRPIIVTNSKLLDFNYADDFLAACIFVQEFIIKNMFLPGQVENWISIYDMGNMGMTQIPVSACTKVFSQLSRNYGGRLYKLFAVNCPYAFKLTWRVISNFLDQVTVNKITIESTANIPGIFQFCDKSQVQVKYGGTQPNRTNFWPFSVPDAVINEQQLVSKEQYKQMLQSGQLKRNVIDPELKC